MVWCSHIDKNTVQAVLSDSNVVIRFGDMSFDNIHSIYAHVVDSNPPKYENPVYKF